jgi:hypothetical protein
MSGLKYYHLVPNYDEFPEDGGSLFLGSIIANPKMPQKSLNPESRKLPETEKVIKGIPFKDWESTVKKETNKKVSFWAKLVQVITLRFNWGYDASDEELFKFDLMTTKFFYPSDDYLKKAMTAPELKRHLETTTAGDPEPLYMVIGLKTVKGATITRKILKSKDIGGEFEADASSSGTVPVGLGMEGSKSTTNKDTRTFKTSDPLVIGYRIRKTRMTSDGNVEQNDETENAYFGIGEGSKEEDDKKWVIAGLDGNDGVASNLEMSLVIDEQGEDCQCVF